MFLKKKHEISKDGVTANTKTVLIAEDDVDIAQALATRLDQLGVSVIRSPDAAHALLGIKKVHPDLVILDINMPGGNGLAVCEMLASDQECNTIPVIIHTACSDELTITRCKYLGAHYVLKSSGTWDKLKAIVVQELNLDTDQAIPIMPAKNETDARSHPIPSSTPSADKTESPVITTQTPLTDSSRQGTIDSDESMPTDHNDPELHTIEQKVPKVLCIDDDPDISAIIKLKLERYDIEVLRAFNGKEGCSTALEENPDVIISDLVLPEGEGAYIFRCLKSDPATKDIPVIILSGQGYPAIKQQILNFGAAAYLTKPLVFNDLLQELRFHIDFPAIPSALSAGSSTTPVET